MKRVCGNIEDNLSMMRMMMMMMMMIIITPQASDGQGDDLRSAKSKFLTTICMRLICNGSLFSCIVSFTFIIIITIIAIVIIIICLFSQDGLACFA